MSLREPPPSDPLASGAEEVLAGARRWRDRGHGVALATVVATWGSSPRRAGSQLAVDERGRFIGSVSGGCVEGAVVEAALGAIRAGEPRLLEFGVTDERAWEVGLACGGRVEIFVERVEPAAEGSAAMLDRVLAARAAGASVVRVVRLPDGAQRLVAIGSAGVGDEVDDGLRALCTEAAAADRSAGREHRGERLFLQVFNPPLRLAVVGAVHIAQALVPLARLAGFEVTVIDPRRAFAAGHRFPEVRLVHAWPDRALEELALDARSAVVTLSHDPKLDDPALAAALRSPAFYLGALGSRRTHAARRERLAAAGFDPQALARIHAPVGLALGAVSPGEIAVAIGAEIVSVLRGGQEPARYGS